MKVQQTENFRSRHCHLRQTSVIFLRSTINF